EALQPGRGEIYNVGSGRGYSVLEVIEACRAVTGRPIAAERAPRRAGDPAELVADPTRLRERLGWEARASELHEIVAR
ncbi:MAG: UDP-glucose 4-epimerase GalE, partial [Trueperaceae bacterium]